MSISFVAFSLILLALCLSLRVGLIAAGGILLPFGMTALISAGGASLNVADVYFIAIGGLYFLRHAQGKLPKNFVLPILFGGLCIVSAFVLPRLFSGVWVFPVNGILDGNRVSQYFNATMSPLRPSSGNISQTAYVILAMFYLALFASIAHRTPEKVHSFLFLAAITNLIISFTVLLLGADILEPFRTADYKTHENAMVGNIRRMVGAFPEASRYADFSAPLGVYFIAHYTATGDKMSMGVGLITTAFALLALSSTGFVAIGAGGAYALFTSFRANSYFKHMFWILLPVIGAVLAIVATAPGLVGELLGRLIFDKGTSVSGLERGAWLAQGWNASVQTYFLGAGAGSVRSNGLFFVLISNVGILGVGMFSVILLRAIRRSADTPLLVGLSAALISILASRLVSQTTIAPGIFFAILIGAKTSLMSKASHDRGSTT